MFRVVLLLHQEPRSGHIVAAVVCRAHRTGQLSVDARVLPPVSGRLRRSGRTTVRLLRREVLRHRAPDGGRIVPRVRRPAGRVARGPPVGVRHGQRAFGTRRTTTDDRPTTTAAAAAAVRVRQMLVVDTVPRAANRVLSVVRDPRRHDLLAVIATQRRKCRGKLFSSAAVIETGVFNYSFLIRFRNAGMNTLFRAGKC